MRLAVTAVPILGTPSNDRLRRANTAERDR
jgi:hypothetical protein